MPDETALHGIRVIDLSEGIAGPFATKLLAAGGAEVIKVEPPAGDVSRQYGPYPGGVPTICTHSFVAAGGDPSTIV